MSNATSPIELSVVIPTYNRLGTLDRALRQVAAAGEQYARPFEVLVVDDGSTDDTAGYFAAGRFPEALQGRLRYMGQENRGPAASRNRGVREAQGRVILFLGDDILITPELLTIHMEAHQSRVTQGTIAVVGQTRWSPEMRLTPLLRFLDEGDQFGFSNIADRENVPFNYFYTSNVSLSRQALLEAGPFDEGFPNAAWEDVELAFRLTHDGIRIVYVPEALAYHFHPTTLESFCRRREVIGEDAVLLYQKHPETSKTINFDSISPLPVWWKVWAAAGFRGFYSLLEGCGLDRGSLRVWRSVFSKLSFYHYFRGVRRALARNRGQLPAKDGGPSRLLLVTHEEIHACLAGPAIRAMEMARAIAKKLDVVVAAPKADACASNLRFKIKTYQVGNEASLRNLCDEADVILVQGYTIQRFPFLTLTDKPLVVDLFCPFSLENLEYRESTATDEDFKREQYSRDLSAVNQQLQVGDFFICATEKQRDFWLGMLHALNRITPTNYGADKSLYELISVVPFGLPAEPPRKKRSVLKGVVPGIDPSDKVLLWGGSLLDWQDPLTLIQAVGLIAESREDVKLFFMGTRHPNPEVPFMSVVVESQRLADKMGLTGRTVFFNDWVPYEERADFLLESDLGVCTHRSHLETRFSFRTRLLDCIWAGVPMVLTEGDTFAELVRNRDLGLTVPPGDPRGLAKAIVKALDDGEARERWKSNLAALRPELAWERVVEPLERFCRRPRLAPDKLTRPVPLWTTASWRLGRNFEVKLPGNPNRLARLKRGLLGRTLRKGLRPED